MIPTRQEGQAGFGDLNLVDLHPIAAAKVMGSLVAFTEQHRLVSSFYALTFVRGSRAVSHATVYDAVHGAFMTLPPYLRSRKGEVPGTSSFSRFAHLGRLVDRIAREWASMREGQLTSLVDGGSQIRSGFPRRVQQQCSRLGARAHFPGP